MSYKKYNFLKIKIRIKHKCIYITINLGIQYDLLYRSSKSMRLNAKFRKVTNDFFSKLTR